VWRGLSSDVTAWARGCLACQRGKIHHHTRLVPLPIPIPQQRFSHLHVDVVGPLQYSNNFNYIFTIIDGTSKVDGSHPPFRNVRGGMRKSFNFYLTFTVPGQIWSHQVVLVLALALYIAFLLFIECL
jgi:hypothetical protein